MIKNSFATYKTWVFLLGLFCFFSASFAQPKVILEGIIEAHETNDDGTPVKAALLVEEIDDEGDAVNRNFIIENNKKGKELLTRVGEAVQIKGAVRKDKEGNDVLTVMEYTVTADEASDEDDDSEDFD